MSVDTVSVPGYRVIRPLGVGGMASVYLAVQESLEREVALKVMAPALAANREFTERFLKEGRITAKLSHPNLVTVYDIGRHETTYYIAAEYIPGGTLRDKMTKGISVAESLDVIRDVAQGLHYAHEKGVVHRDVKPGNILFRLNGTAVLADFGIAKSVDSGTMSTQAGNSIGTPHYMSPEQARAEKVDGRSDLYSLGAVLFELLVGQAPYDAPDPFTIALMHVTHPVPTLPAKLAWLQPLVSGLMAKDPNERFASGEAFVLACDKLIASAPEAASIRDSTDTRKRSAPRLTNTGRQRLLGGGGAAKARPLSEIAADRPGPSKALIAGAAAAVMLVLALGGWWLVRGPGPASDVATVPSPTPSPALTVPTPVPSPVATPVSPPVVDLNATPLTTADVAAMIAQANQYVAQGFAENGRRLVSPEGDSAADLYRRVLEAEPNHAEAQAGLERIAAYFLQKAQAAKDRGINSSVMILAEQGLRAQPEHAELKALYEESKAASGL